MTDEVLSALRTAAGRDLWQNGRPTEGFLEAILAIEDEAAALPAASPALDVERLAVAWIDLIERAMWALPWREYATERDLAVNIVRRLEELHGPEGGLLALARLAEQEAADHAT